MSEGSRDDILLLTIIVLGFLTLLTICMTGWHIEEKGFDFWTIGYALGIGFGYLTYGLCHLSTLNAKKKDIIFFLSILTIGGVSMLIIGLTSNNINKHGFEIETLGSYALSIGLGFLAYGLFKLSKSQ